MKNFAEYIQKLIQAKKISEFPVKKDFDYTTSFILPELGTSEGIYRTLLPAMYLTNETTIRCVPVGLSELKDSLSINQKDYEIRKGLAEISNHIVFPFLSYSLEPIIADLKNINPKLKFSYYIDYNYYFIPDNYPFSNEYGGAENIANIEKNITLVDQVIVTNRPLYLYLSLELSKKENIKGCKTNICYQPLFFDKSFTEQLSQAGDNKKKKKTRFGMVLNKYQFNDMIFIKGILKEFQKKHGNETDIIILGWNGMYQDKNYFAGLNVEYFEPVIFFDYFEKLNSLNIDCFIIPAKANKFNDTSKSYIKYIEFTRLNKPVICPEIEPYKAIIKHNDNGLLCNSKGSWLHEMETFLKEKEKYNLIFDRAYNSVLDYEISEAENLKVLMEIYEI